MTRFSSIFVFLCTVLIVAGQSYAKKLVHVAILETKVLENAISKSERAFLTDELRSQAMLVLPDYKDFIVMTQENIRVMLPPDKSLEDCEGDCLVETGKNIAADYVSQARVGKFGSDLTLTVELYETYSGKMLASYTSTNHNAQQLLVEIKNRSAMLFGTIPGAISPNNGGYGGGKGGFSDVSMGQQWSSSKVKKYVIDVSSNPTGALLNIDGRPQSNCRSTPCSVELSEGNHKFTFVMDMYFDLDTIVNVDSYTYDLQVRMKPNFGTLRIDPSYPDGYASSGELTVKIGDEDASMETILSPGKYRVSLEHPCYENVVFTANIARGKEFRFDKVLVPKKGHVSISARQGNTPQRVDVYVNGNWAGKTPFDEDVSVCADITVGDDGVQFPYAVIPYQDLEWVYEMEEAEGWLKIDPNLTGSLGYPSDLVVRIDGEIAEQYTSLSPGKYRVVLEHPCYRDVTFNAKIVSGKETRYNKDLVPRKGHVSIRARQGYSSKTVDVYVNGEFAGTTPFESDVPVCANITVGDGNESFPYTIQEGESVQWTYDVPEPKKSSYNSSYYSNDTYTGYYYSSSSSRSYSYNSYKPESSASYDYDYDTESDKPESEIASSASANGAVKFVIQGEFGISGEFLEASNVEDEEIRDLLSYNQSSYYGPYSYYGSYDSEEDTTTVFADYLYANLFLGLEFGSFVTVGVGFGIGSFFMSASGDEELDEMLPGASFAPNIMAELTLGTDFVFGIRYRYIFDSRWPSSRISGIGELLNVFGLEIGATSTKGLGENIFVSFYIRFPTRANLSEALDKKK